MDFYQSARISEIESKLSENQEELAELQNKMDHESSNVTRTIRADFERQLEQQTSKASAAVKEAIVLKNEVIQFYLICI